VAFWSGETLLARLPKLIPSFNKKNIDCASYTLHIGERKYVSPTDRSIDAETRTIDRLDPDQAFTVPPGQFAFLETAEEVSVPSDALGLISIKATIKFRGLVNVSGFHVDPGFKGRLVFSVFNAGPATIHLKRGEPCFLIWYAQLDTKSEFIRRSYDDTGLQPRHINNISGQLQSIDSLLDEMRELRENVASTLTDTRTDLTDRVHKVEVQQSRYWWFVGAVIAALGWLLSASRAPAPTMYTPAAVTVPSGIASQSPGARLRFHPAVGSPRS
jgi:dCTP deaminase